MKTVQAYFSKGINGVADRRLLPDGCVAIADNIDFRSGSAKPFKLPSFSHTATAGTTCIWSYGGKWYYSPLYRKYTAESQGSQERVYFSEVGSSTVPQKIINGVQDQLGTMAPIVAPFVAQSSDAVPLNINVTMVQSGGNLTPGSYAYRIAAIIDGNTCVPSQEFVINIPETSPIGTNRYANIIEWDAVEDATGYVVFGRNPGGEQVLATLGLATSWTDDGSMTPSGSFASTYDAANPLTYVYTYIRKVGPMIDESGPSPASLSITAGNARIVTRFPLTDGFFANKSTIAAVTSAASSITATPTGILQGSNSAVLTFGSALSADWELPTKYTPELRFWDGTAAWPSDYNLEFSRPTALVSPSITSNTIITDSGSTLSAGTYAWAVTAIKGQTNITSPAETAKSPNSTNTITTGQAVVLEWSAVSNADGYKVYRYNSSTSTWAVVGITGPNTTFITDIGQTVTGSSTPPSSNTTATNIITINNAVLDASIISGLTPVYLAKTVLTSTGPTGVLDQDNQVVYCSGASNAELNGTHIAHYIGSTSFWVQSFSPSSDSFAAVYRPTDKNNYTGWRLYRAGDSGDAFLLVDEISIGDSTYTDFVGVTNLGDALPSSYTDNNGVVVTYAPPPRDLIGVESYNGMLFGVQGNNVRWTPVGVPDAWPDTYSMSFDYTPLCLASFNGALIVFCQDSIYRIDGFDAGDLSLHKTKADGCIAPYSVQPVGSYLLYLAKRGVMMFTGGDAACISEASVPYKMLLYPGSYPSGYSKQDFYWQTTDNTSAYGQMLWVNSEAISAIDEFGDINARNVVPDDVVYDIRSFSWQNKYFIYYTTANGNNYSAGTTWCFDLLNPSSISISTLGLKPVDAHVTATGEAYLLLGDNGGSLDNANAFIGYQSKFDSGPYTYTAPSSVSVYRFNQIQAQNAPIRMRSGEVTLNNPTMRKRWRQVLVSGDGTGQLRVYLDGALKTFANGNTYASIDCNSTPSHLHRVLLPVGSWAYSVAWEIIGDIKVRAIELGFDPMAGEE